MYLDYWPPLGDRSGSPVPAGTSTSPMPAAWLDRGRSLIDSIGRAAAEAYAAAQTVAPDMQAELWNSTGQGTPATAAAGGAYTGAPEVLPLNAGWTPPARTPSPCPEFMVNAGPPWSDALYRAGAGLPVSDSLIDWARRHPLLAALVAGAGAAGLFYLGSDKR